jgi:lysophospholipase
VQLHPTPANPIPGEPVVMTVRAADGVPLRAARWLPPGPVQGTVCVLQGRAEFIEKYFETVGDLLMRGFAVVAFDWRGQGLSGREVRNARKGHVRRFEDYRKDLDAIRDQVLLPFMPEPHFALAHSMGGAIALIAAAEEWLPFRRLVTTAPMVALSITKRPKGAAAAARCLKLLGFGRSFIPGGGETSIAEKPFAGNLLTSDPVRYARNADAAAAIGAGAIGDPTVAWLDSAFRVMRRFLDPRFGLKVRLPTLILCPGADGVCATPAAERFAARLKAGHAIVLPGARHEILMERDAIREQFWAAFDAFVPGTPDPTFGLEPETSRWGEPGLPGEELEHGGMEPAVAGGDDGAPLSR